MWTWFGVSLEIYYFLTLFQVVFFASEEWGETNMHEIKKFPKDVAERVSPEHAKETFFRSISAVERLHQKLHEILAFVLNETDFSDVSPVQALLIYNISDNRITVGELKSRGFYLGTNVTYNLKQLVSAGYVNQVITPADKRSMLVSLTRKGKKVRNLLNNFFNQEITTILESCPLEFEEIETGLKVTETWDEFWEIQIANFEKT